MKKLITLAAACLSLGALVACGKGSDTPSKTDWTDAEKELISECTFRGLEFTPLLSSVEFDEDYENLVFSGKKATQKDIEALGTLLESKDYGFHEFVRGQYASYYLSDDLANCHEFSDDFDVVEYFRFASTKVPSSYVGYGPFSFFDLVAIGADEETGNLVMVSAPMYMKFSYINLDYEGFSFYSVDQEEGDFLVEASGHLEEAFFDLFALDEEGETSVFEEGVFAYPEADGSDYFGLLDYAYMFPWSRGNMLSSSYSYEAGFDILTSEDSHDNLAEALVEAGFEEGEHNDTYEEVSFVKASETEGFYYVVTLGDWSEDHVELTSGSEAGYSVTYTFFEYDLSF